MRAIKLLFISIALCGCGPLVQRIDVAPSKGEEFYSCINPSQVLAISGPKDQSHKVCILRAIRQSIGKRAINVADLEGVGFACTKIGNEIRKCVYRTESRINQLFGSAVVGSPYSMDEIIVSIGLIGNEKISEFRLINKRTLHRDGKVIASVAETDSSIPVIR